MSKKEYKTIIVSVGKFQRKYEMRENFVTSFVIEGSFYHLIGTLHSLKRLEERGVSKYHVASTIMALGDKINRYNNSGKHIIISDESKGISTVFTVERHTIVLVTVLDKGEMLISSHVDKETIIETA